MKKNKLFISTIAVAVAVASGGTVSTGAASAFSDVSKNNSHYDAIMELAKRGIIHGYGDGTFRPENPVTRGQAAKMIAGILGMNTGAVPSTGFSDVSADREFAGAIMALKQLGVIGGYNDGTFRPNAPISRNELAIILTRALQLQLDETIKLPFTDVHADYKVAVATMYKYGITQGITETTFGGKTAVTRGQLSTFIVRAERMLAQAPVEETAAEVKLIVEDIEKEWLKTANQKLKIGKTVQSLLNETNAKALTGATIQAKVLNDEIVSITALELNASGTEGAPVTFNGGDTTFEGEMTINADFVELKNLKIAGNVTLTRKAVTSFETNQVEVKGEIIVEDTAVSPVASFVKIANSSTPLIIKFKRSSIARLSINRSNVRVVSDLPLLKVVLQENAKDNVINANINELILRLQDVKLTGTGTINRLEIPERTDLDRSKREFELLWNGTINELSIMDAFVQILISKDTKVTVVIIPDGIHPTSIFKNLTSFLNNFGKFMLKDGTVIIVQNSSYVEETNSSYVPSPPAPAPTVPSAPTGLLATAVTAAGNDGMISGTAKGQEYRKQGDSNWTAITGPTVTGLEAGTYEVRVKETATSLASDSTTVIVNAYVPAPTGLLATAVTAAGNDGMISGTAKGQEYRKQGDSNW
ncbi:MAG: S-layer homology domain-containing protein, partial [Solibacillus sp.]|uniref:S-layer homology domain-containing protein n=1 Tax=Solibacillus sp. TaxID=1909654 RepID=UPI0033164BE8